MTMSWSDFPTSLKAKRHGAVLRLNRAQKRNTLDDPIVAGIETLNIEFPCPLWVISRHSVQETPCPLYPRKRTSAERIGNVR